MKNSMQVLSQEQTQLVSGGTSLAKIREDIERAKAAMDAAALAKALKKLSDMGGNVNY